MIQDYFAKDTELAQHWDGVLLFNREVYLNVHSASVLTTSSVCLDESTQNGNKFGREM